MRFIKKIIRFSLSLTGYKLQKIRAKDEFINPDKADTFGLDKINYGCYRNYLEGWLNADRDISERPDFKTVRVDLAARHPFGEGTFRFGFAEDFVACLTQGEFIVFLHEVFLTFRKGGVLRISTPGLEGVLKKHFTGITPDTLIPGKSEAYELSGNIQFPSLPDLVMIAKHIGFSEVKEVEYGQSEHPELRNLDTRFEQIGLNTIVEITK